MAGNISNLIVTGFSLIGAIMAAILIGLAIWTFRDIRSRTRDVLAQILAPLMVFVIPIGGLIVYFLLRPRETLSEKYVRALEEESLLSSIENQEFCPTCGRRVDGDMRFCPSCHTKLRNECGNCGRAVHLSWDMCPYCGTPQQPESPVVAAPKPKQVAPPVARAVSPPPPTQSIPAPAVAAPVATAAVISKSKPGFSVSGMLDKVGGAIEGAVNKVSPRGQADDELE